MFPFSSMLAACHAASEPARPAPMMWIVFDVVICFLPFYLVVRTLWQALNMCGDAGIANAIVSRNIMFCEGKYFFLGVMRYYRGC